MENVVVMLKHKAKISVSKKSPALIKMSDLRWGQYATIKRPGERIDGNLIYATADRASNDLGTVVDLTRGGSFRGCEIMRDIDVELLSPGQTITIKVGN